MSKDIDVSVQEVTTALTKAIEAAGELVRCTLHVWEVIGEARSNEPSSSGPGLKTYSPTYKFDAALMEDKAAAAMKKAADRQNRRAFR